MSTAKAPAAPSGRICEKYRLVDWLIVFNVPSTARSFRDGEKYRTSVYMCIMFITCKWFYCFNTAMKACICRLAKFP